MVNFGDAYGFCKLRTGHKVDKHVERSTIAMGVYLNSKNAYAMYKKESLQPYFVDKSQMLEELFPLIKNGNNQICITRPRRFGKTVMANMISSFFSKGCDADDVVVR